MLLQQRRPRVAEPCRYTWLTVRAPPRSADRARAAADALRALVPASGAYVNENDWAEPSWQVAWPCLLPFACGSRGRGWWRVCLSVCVILRQIWVRTGSHRRDAASQAAFFGTGYDRLLRIKRAVDPSGVFRCHQCVGSELALA